MKIEGIRTLAGPNVYTHRPALLLKLDLRELAGRESREFEGFEARLLEALPGLCEHQCSRGRAGGFVERLREGTYFGHVVEHVALELTSLAGVGTGSIVRLGWGVHRRFIQAATSELTSAVAVELASDKDLTKLVLEQAAVPVPRGQVVETEDEALGALRRLGPPVVVKPLDGRQGYGVSLDLSTEEEVREAFRIARDFSSSVLVEELLVGRNYRVLVVGGEVVAASERLPCHVRGDGARSIAELVEVANQDPLRGEGHEKPLTKIVVDEIVLAHLHKHGLALEHIPEA